MGQAAGAVSSVASLASAGLSFIGAKEKGAGEKAADDYQAARAKSAARYAETAAAQTDAGMRENLNVTLDNIDAVRAAAGVDPSSPTTAALRERTSELGNRARSIQVDNILAQANQDNADAAYMTQAGSYAMKMANLGAWAGLIKAGGQAFGSMGGMGGGAPGYGNGDAVSMMPTDI